MANKALVYGGSILAIIAIIAIIGVIVYYVEKKKTEKFGSRDACMTFSTLGNTWGPYNATYQATQ